MARKHMREEKRMAQFEAVLDDKKMTAAEVAKKVKMGASSARVILNKMVDDGCLDFTGSGGGNDPFVYYVKRYANGNGAPKKPQASAAPLVKTTSVKNGAVPTELLLSGALGLALAKVEIEGQLTLTKDSDLYRALKASHSYYVKNLNS